MSAFRFEEATALGPAETERLALAAELPPDEDVSGVVPVLARPRHLSRRR